MTEVSLLAAHYAAFVTVRATQTRHTTYTAPPVGVWSVFLANLRYRWAEYRTRQIPAFVDLKKVG